MSGQRIDLAALREIAKEATSGPWWIDADGDVTAEERPIALATFEKDAAFIVAADPQMVLALVEAVEAARAEDVAVNREQAEAAEKRWLAARARFVFGDEENA